MCVCERERVCVCVRESVCERECVREFVCEREFVCVCVRERKSETRQKMRKTEIAPTRHAIRNTPCERERASERERERESV